MGPEDTETALDEQDEARDDFHSNDDDPVTDQGDKWDDGAAQEQNPSPEE